MPAPVLVTRPAREAARWVDGLRAAGLDAWALPLIEVGPAPDAATLARAREQVPQYALAMFVSANAVHGLLGEGSAPWPPGTRAWATGPGTLRALQAAGVPQACIDAPEGDSDQFDSEALWARAGERVRPGSRALVVRGGDEAGRPTGRDWLAGRLQAAGAQVDTVVAYVRRAPRWDAAQQALAEAGARGGWWLFSSSEAVGHLRALRPGQDWSAARALCTHPRIAQAAAQAGFGEVAQARPVLGEVSAFLQSRP